MKVVKEIELRSDTMTKPSMEMKNVMFNAVVGDDGYGEDPTVRDLEIKAALMFGKPAARFFPTGLMGNLASMMSHCWERGQEVLLGDLCHIHMFEQGGIAQIANIHSRTLLNKPNGTFDICEVQQKIRNPNDVHSPRTQMICLENTHNRCSGAVLSQSFIDDVSNVARSHNLKLHVDGARIFNAAVASQTSCADILRNCDSVAVCLSKGLGCPAGNIVAGSEDFIERATRCRKLLGGSMRQSGILAAAGIYALDHMVDRLADDHHNAQVIAQAISSCKSDIVTVDVSRVDSNIVMAEINSDFISNKYFTDRLKQVTEEERESLTDETCIVKCSPQFGSSMVRFVTHCDTNFEDIQLAMKKVKYVIGELDKNPPLNPNARLIGH